MFADTGKYCTVIEFIEDQRYNIIWLVLIQLLLEFADVLKQHNVCHVKMMEWLWNLTEIFCECGARWSGLGAPLALPEELGFPATTENSLLFQVGPHRKQTLSVMYI